MSTVDRLSITFAPEVGEAVRGSAKAQGISVSAWLAQAAAARLRNEQLGAALDAWEREDGAFTDEELAAAARSLRAAAEHRSA